MSTEVKNPMFARLYSRMVEDEDDAQVAHRREALDPYSPSRP